MRGNRRAELRASDWLYAALLGLYPAPFRAVYGPHMRLTFRDACRAAYQRDGGRGLLALWVPTLFDLFHTALAERARSGGSMLPRERWLTLTGPLTILIGLLWLLASVGELVLLVGLGSPDSFWDMFWLFPVALSFILMVPAFSLTRQRYQGTAGGLGRLGLALSVAGCAAMISFALVSIGLGAFGVEQEAWADAVIAACVLTLMLGHVLWGLDALRTKPLPRWNVTPLLVGLPTLLLAAPSLLIDQSTPNAFELTLLTTCLRFALTGAGWVLLGLAMREARPAAQPAAAAH